MSLTAIFLFLLVAALHLFERYLEIARKRGSHTDEQTKLRLEIKQILEMANQLSTPSTFAQASKLKRLAATKEKELATIREQDLVAKHSLNAKYRRILMITKVLMCAALILWFWRTPVTTVPQHLVHPFGKVFSLKSSDASGRIVVGILPWLYLTARVSKLLCQKLSPLLEHL